MEQSQAYRSAVARANQFSQDPARHPFRHHGVVPEDSGPDPRRNGLKNWCGCLRGRPRPQQKHDERGGAPWEVVACHSTSRSQGGGAIFACGLCLNGWWGIQNVVANGSGEAELLATVRDAAEGTGLKSMVGDLGLEMALGGACGWRRFLWNVQPNEATSLDTTWKLHLWMHGAEKRRGASIIS